MICLKPGDNLFGVVFSLALYFGKVIAKKRDSPTRSKIAREGVFIIYFPQFKAGRGPHPGDVIEVVSPATDGDNWDAEGFDPFDGGEPFLLAAVEVGEGVGDVGVGAHLQDDCLGGETFERRDRSIFKSPEPDVAGCSGLEGDIEGGKVFSDFINPAGAREKSLPFFVDGNSEDGRVFEPDPLDAVAVMNVDIDVGDSVEFFAKDVESNGGVVVDAESAGFVAVSMVETTTNSEREPGAVSNGLSSLGY